MTFYRKYILYTNLTLTRVKMLKMYNFDYLLARSVYDFDIPVSAKTIYFSLSIYVLETVRSKEKKPLPSGGK